MKFSDKEDEKLRKKRNQELIERMRNGDNLQSFSSEASWFPPRPVIEKDKSVIDKLYGNQEKKDKLKSPFRLVTKD